MKTQTLQQILQERIVVIDGAMGTMIQKHQLKEEDYRSTEFADWHKDIKGHNDILSITQPHIIKSIHTEYLEAGADIIETNTFSSQKISLADFEMEHLDYRLNYESAKIAKEACIAYTQKTNKQVFVAGAIGPTNRTLSLSPNVNDPGFRSVTFDEVVAAYYEQVKGLVEGGADLLIIETIFDTLNAKAAIFAIEQYFEDCKKPALPLMISVTISDNSGRTLSGQTLEAFYISIAHAKPISVGLNCALGGKEMKPFVQQLKKIAACAISCYPNAGLPNALGAYDELPSDTAKYLQEMLSEQLVNIIGGCCGTTPQHIQAIAKMASQYKPS